jgi:hypothetical protein
MVPELLNKLNKLAASIKKNRAFNVNSETLKQATVAVGSYYFKECRDEISRSITATQDLLRLDQNWQQLIRLAHGNNSKKSYLSVIKNLLKQTKELAIAAQISASSAASITEIASTTQSEQILIRTLDQIAPTAALSYQQGINDLSFSSTRLSYRGSACEFREVLRETLDHLAPDNDVTNQAWFKLDHDCTCPTMKQKVRFILTSRGKNKAQRALAEKSVDLLEQLCGAVTRAVYDRASLSTHAETTKQEVARIKRYLDAVLFDILEIRQSG